MPITGFLEGYNEQRKVEQTLEDQRQLAGLRATEIAANVNKLQTDLAVKSTLAQIFTGPEQPPGPNDTPDDVTNNKLRKAGIAIMAADPVRGLAFTNAAAVGDQKKALAKKEQLDSDIKARDEQGGYLTAMKNQDTQDAYDTLLPKALQSGWKLPSWFTGNWAKDRLKIGAEADGTMKASEQATVQKNLMADQFKLADMTRKAEAAEASAKYQEIKTAMQQQARDTANRSEDRRQAQGRERLNRMALPGDADISAAKAALEARTDVPENLDPNAKKEIIRRAATDAKRTALRNDTDFDEEINNSLGRILREDLDEPKKKEYGLPFGLMPSLTLWTKEGARGLKTKNSAKSKVDEFGGQTQQTPRQPELKALVEAKGEVYDPTTYEYRVVNGRVQRRKKD